MTKDQKLALIQLFADRADTQGLGNPKSAKFQREQAAFFAGAMAMDNVLTNASPNASLTIAILMGNDVRDMLK